MTVRKSINHPSIHRILHIPIKFLNDDGLSLKDRWSYATIEPFYPNPGLVSTSKLILDLYGSKGSFKYVSGTFLIAFIIKTWEFLFKKLNRLKHIFMTWITTIILCKNILIIQTTLKKKLRHLSCFHFQTSEPASSKRMSWSTYNQFHNILRQLDVLPNLPFTTTGTTCNYYL